MNFENRQTHQTVFGGIISICVGIGFSTYFLYSMLSSDQFYLKDTISTYAKRHGFDEPQPGELCHNGTDPRMSFEMYVNDATYDNDDNPYGKLIFHQFSNMENVNDTRGNVKGFIDMEIPLIECKGKKMEWRKGGVKYYCPDYQPDIHFLHGGFYGEKFSWQRIGLHLCDNSTEAIARKKAENKTYDYCVSEEEQIKYYQGVIIGMEAVVVEANIDEQFSKNLYSTNPEK